MSARQPQALHVLHGLWPGKKKKLQRHVLTVQAAMCLDHHRQVNGLEHPRMLHGPTRSTTRRSGLDLRSPDSFLSRGKSVASAWSKKQVRSDDIMWFAFQRRGVAWCKCSMRSWCDAYRGHDHDEPRPHQQQDLRSTHDASGRRQVRQLVDSLWTPAKVKTYQGMKPQPHGIHAPHEGLHTSSIGLPKPSQCACGASIVSGEPVH